MAFFNHYLNEYPGVIMSGDSLRRCDRNRKRSKPGGRRLKCLHHDCPLQSLHHKHRLFASTTQQHRQSSMAISKAATLSSEQNVIPLSNEWLENFWCQECMHTSWYHVKKSGDTFHLLPATRSIWRRACGVINMRGHITASDFTLRNSRKLSITDR